MNAAITVSLPLLKRVLEAGIGLLAISLVVLSVYLTVDSFRTGELTWPKVRDNWGLAYAGLFLTAVVLILGARLIFPTLAPQGRLLTRSGIIVFFVFWLGNMVTVIYRTGRIPPIAIVVVVAAIGGIAIRKWFS